MIAHLASKTGRVAAGGSLLLGGVAGALVLAPQAGAVTTFHVINTDDAGTGSLRQAVDDANNNAGADIIVFDAGSAGTITLTNGDIVITDDVTITGLGAADSIVSGNNASRIFYIFSNGAPQTVSISGLTLTDGQSSLTSGGGAIYNADADLTLSSVIISNNTAGNEGGGGVSHQGGNLTIQNSLFQGNISGNGGGGGVYTTGTGDITIDSSAFDQNTAGYDGGGLYATNTTSFTMTNSTVSGNQARDGAGIELGRNGDVLIANSTIANNVGDPTNGYGGALYSWGSTGDMRIIFSTISGNSTKRQTVRLMFYGGYSLDMTGTIISDNTTYEGTGVQAVDLYLYNGGNGGAGSLTVSSSLIMGTTIGDSFTDGGGNVTGVSAQLGALADNGGATFTMEPAVGSPVIDAGPLTWTAFAGDGFDQRATPYVRVYNGQSDMGALEVQSEPAPPTTTTTTGPTTTVATDPVVPAFTG